MSDNGGNSSKGRGRTKHDSISEDDNKNEERSEETGETSKVRRDALEEGRS